MVENDHGPPPPFVARQLFFLKEVVEGVLNVVTSKDSIAMNSAPQESCTFCKSWRLPMSLWTGRAMYKYLRSSTNGTATCTLLFVCCLFHACFSHFLGTFFFHFNSFLVLVVCVLSLCCRCRCCFCG